MAAGIIAILYGSLLLTPALVLVGFAMSEGPPAASAVVYLALATAIGNLISGIALMAKDRGRRRAAPMAVLAFSVLPVLLSLAGIIAEFRYAVLLSFSLIFAVPVCIVLGIGLMKEKRGH